MLNRKLSQKISAVAAGSAVLLGASVLLPKVVSAQEQAPTLLSQNAVQTATVTDRTLYLNSDRSYSFELAVTNGGSLGGFYLPPGATIQGNFVPADGGLRYVANSVIIDGQVYNLNAASEVLQPVKDPRDTSAGAVGEDAAIGAGAGVVLGEVFGDAGIGEIVGGAAAGAVVGNVTADRVVVIEENEPIALYAQ